MLRIYICPNCYNFRMVSRKPDAICLHCGTRLHQSELEYGAFINMTENDRNEYKKNFIDTIKNDNDILLKVQLTEDKRTFL